MAVCEFSMIRNFKIQNFLVSRARLAMVILAFFCGTSLAKPTDRAKQITTPNLIEESSRISIMSEDSVQNEQDSSRRIYGFTFNTVSTQRISLFANGRLTEYINTQNRSALGAQLGVLPIKFYGYMGLLGTLQYANLAQESSQSRTVLHWTSADLALAYRYEMSARSWIKPIVTLGGGSQIFMQKGELSDDNTSEARGYGTYGLGAAFNVNRLFKSKSILQMELIAHYKRIVSPTNERYDLNGQTLSAGLGIAL